MNSDGCWENVNMVQNDEHPNLNVNIAEGNIRSLRVNDYIPKRFTKKLEIPHIIGIAVIFILLIIIIILASITNKSTSSVEHTKAAEVIDNTSALVECTIVMSDGNRFWMYNPQKGSLKLIWEVKNSTQAFVMDETKTLYWIETNSWKIFSLNLSETKKNESLFFEGSSAKLLKNPSMALDSINNNLYIVDESIIGLVIINTVTKYYALMSIDLVNPRYVVLDAAKGIMFISSIKWIKRAAMDGNNLLTIANNKTISALTLDREGETIYWIHNSEFIESSDYFGQKEQQLFADYTSVIDASFLDGHIFWLRKSSGIQEKTIWSCKVQNGSCGNHSIHKNTNSTARFIKFLDHTQQNLTQQNTSNHQNCEHISLTTPSGQMSCICNMSSQLVFHRKCEPITEFILYTLNGDVRARNMDVSKKVILEPIWPTPYYNETLLKEKNNIDFDYDFENDDFYFSDDRKIYKIKLKGINPQQEVVLTVNSQELRIENLAYDWLSENMYYLKICKRSNLENSIVVFNVKKGAGFQKTVSKSLVNSYYYSYGRYGSLVTYPSQGILFLLADGESGQQFKMNGTLILKMKNNVGSYTIATIDFEENRLYFSNGIMLTHANFNNTDIKKIYLKEEVSNIKSISINRQWIYLSNYIKVWRVNKETGIFDNLVSPQYDDAPSKINSGARVISQTQVKENPCRVRNGDCEQFCFYGPKATCDCADGFTVTSIGQCTKNNT